MQKVICYTYGGDCMKKVGKIVLGILITIYAVVAIFLTACLLNYNDFKITEFGETSLIIVNDEELEPTYKKGSLLVVNKKNADQIKVGDSIIFYNTYNNQVSLAISEVIFVEKVNEEETTYTISGNYDISSEYLVGSTNDTKIYPVVGSILGLLESRAGFLIFIIFPITIAFLYEIYVLVVEIKDTKKEVKKTKKVVKETEKEEE